MLHPHTRLRFINELIGYGVVATQLIPRGTITWVRCSLDQTFRPDQLVGLHPTYLQVLDKYGFQDGEGDTVLCWDHGRFVNHSCAPTCLSPGHQFEIAVRDILPGEQLTDDYATLNLDAAFRCACGTPECRGELQPDDTFALADQWDAQIAEVYPLIREVNQPLWELVREREVVEAELDGRRPIASCRANLVGHPRPSYSEAG